MKRTALSLLLIINWLFVFAQNPSPVMGRPGQMHKMAVFVPLYLDEAFSPTGTYLFSDKSFPKNSISGLEFYHGVNIAIDSLSQLGVPLDVYIYDSKSTSKTIDQQFAEAASNGVELAIVNGAINELPRFANLGLKYKIPVINATVPNDANVKNNPYFVIINPTLQTQMEGIYNHIKSNYPNSQIVFLTNKGNNENYIRSLFQGIDKTLHGIGSVKYASLADSVTLYKTLATLDKSKPVTFVGGTLSTTDAANMIKKAASVVSNEGAVNIIGMPTWEDVVFSNAEYKSVNIIYSTPFYNPRTDVQSRNIINYYNTKMYSRPSDLVFRGYGLTYKYGNLLNTFGKELGANFDSKLFKVFYDYDIQPVFGANRVLNYFENKKLYFIKHTNGALTGVL